MDDASKIDLASMFLASVAMVCGEDVPMLRKDSV